MAYNLFITQNADDELAGIVDYMLFRSDINLVRDFEISFRRV